MAYGTVGRRIATTSSFRAVGNNRSRRGFGHQSGLSGRAASWTGRAPQQQQQQRAESLTDLLGLENEDVTMEILRRRPELLEVPTQLLVYRLLTLKGLLPGANLPEMLRLQPSLLLLEDPDVTVGRALRQLHALMPGIPVESKLHEGGSVWWSFIGLIPPVPSSPPPPPPPPE